MGVMVNAAADRSTLPPPAGWGLRGRIHAILAGLMGIFIAILLWLQIEATRASVREEIVASNLVASQFLERASWIVARGGPEAMAVFLRQLGHVRANDIALVDEQGHTMYRSPPPTYKQGRSAPEWFQSLVAPPLQRHVIPVVGATLTIEADASRAVLDGWDDLEQLALMGAVMLLAINLAVFWALEHTIRPFSRIVDALQKMRAGDYSHRLPQLPGREARLIGDSVNQLGEAIDSNLQQRLAAYEIERKLAESRDWAHQVEQRLEAERREIAAELHDELGQSVTAIRSLARTLMQRLPDVDAPSKEAAGLIDEEAARLYDAMHGLIPRLTPLSLGPLGLPDALSDLVATARQRHPSFYFGLHVDGVTLPVAPAVALVAYRVAQESVNNAIKHSGAGQIDVCLSLAGPGMLSLTISDNGRGLQRDRQGASGFGLTSLRERVLSVGGEFTATSLDGGGTRVAATLPLEAAK